MIVISLLTFVVVSTINTTQKTDISTTSTNCEMATDVPFVAFQMERSKSAPRGKLLVTADGNDYCLALSPTSHIFTGSTVPVFVKKSSNGTFVIGREKYTGALRIGKILNAEVSEIPISITSAKNLQIEATFNLGDDIIILGYEPDTMIASGAGLKTTEQRLGAYLLSSSLSEANNPELTFTGLSIPGGLDQQVFTAQLDDEKSSVVCQEVSCYQFISGSSKSGVEKNPRVILLPNIPTTPSERIVELVPYMDGIGALVQSRNEAEMPKYKICSSSPPHWSPNCYQYAGNGIPYDLKVDSQQVLTVNNAENSLELEKILRLDMLKNKSGVGQLGAGNFEGRIAWSNVYFVNGLLDLTLKKNNLSTEFRQDVIDRLKHETNVISGQISSSNGLISRRYSLGRSDNVFLLHVARVLQVLYRARDASSEELPSLKSAISKLEEAMIPGVSTVETLSTTNAAAQGTLDQLIYQRGSSFWADGANVPFNYESGWISAVASSTNMLADNKLFETASAIVLRHWNSMQMTESPRTWSYSDGLLASGWSEQENVSTNTPSYAGDQNPPREADISYRTMDITAFLLASKVGILSVPQELDDYAISLIRESYLWPQVLAYIGPNYWPQDCSLDMTISQFARSNNLFELENQAWMLILEKQGNPQQPCLIN